MNTIHKETKNISGAMAELEKRPGSGLAQFMLNAALDKANEAIEDMPDNINSLSLGTVLIDYALISRFTDAIKPLQQTLRELIPIIISERVAAKAREKGIEIKIETLRAEDLREILSEENEEAIIANLSPFAQEILSGFATGKSRPLASWLAVRNELKSYPAGEIYLGWIDKALAKEIEKLDSTNDIKEIIALAGRLDELSAESRKTLINKLEKIDMSTLSKDDLVQLAKHFSQLPPDIKTKLINAIVNLLKNSDPQNSNALAVADLPPAVQGIVLAALPEEQATAA
jgi:hypothetical protein